MIQAKNIVPRSGSQACLVSYLFSFVSRNSRSRQDQNLGCDPGILSWVPSTPDCIWEHSGWITAQWYGPARREGGGREELTKKRVCRLSALWKSQICWSLIQEQDSTLTINITVCGELMIDLEKSWHLTHLFKQHQDSSSSAHSQITQSSPVWAQHKYTSKHCTSLNNPILTNILYWQKIPEIFKSLDNTIVLIHSNLISPQWHVWWC